MNETLTTEASGLGQILGLVDLLESQNEIKKDYLSPTGQMFFLDGKLHMTHAGQTIQFNPTDHFHGQAAEKLGIPKGYYDRMKGRALNLLDQNVNHWLSDEGKNMLVRTFDGHDDQPGVARAMLSDRYSMIDNYEVLLETLDAIRSTGSKIEVVSAELSDTRMYLKVVAPEVEVQAKEMLRDYKLAAKVGTSIFSGFTVQNCEIGGYSFMVAPRAVVKACMNGMVKTDDTFRRVHLGGKIDELGMDANDRIKNANRKLIREQLSHAIKLFLSKEYLNKLVDSFTVLGQKEIVAPLSQVVEVIAKNYGIDQDRKNSILNYFIKGGDTRRIGMVNAITEEVQGLKDVDQKNDGEMMTYGMLQKFDSIEAEAIKLSQSAN